METHISARLAAVHDEIRRACTQVNRSPDSVTLVAVSKTHPAATVAAAAAAGLRHFGENRVEEAIDKMPQVASLTDAPVEWHLIGHVQSRKARYVVAGGFTLLHSLDSLKLAERISRALVEQGAALDVLLEMNVSGEESKHGWQASGWTDSSTVRQDLWADIGAVLKLPGFTVRGLMTMAPIVEEAEAARPVFAALRGLRDALANDFPAVEWPDLSMGMTDDYPVAVQEGATLVRIGRALFGSRP
jgi:pyridoxal phosphate enzyme (YggS family)